MANNDYHRRLDLIVQNTTNMVVVTNCKREIEWVNPAYTRVTGWTLEEVKGRNPKSFLHGPRTNLAASSQLGERLRLGLPVQDFEVLNYTKAGTPYWVSLSIQPVVGADGTVAEYVAIQTDITERKRREAETARAYRRLAEAQRMAGIGYMEHELSSGTIQCSPEIYRILDADPGPAAPSYEELMACTYPEDLAEVRARYEQAINDGLPYDAEHRVLSKTGRVKWVHLRGALEGWDDGSPALCRLVVQDITERKQAEQLAQEKQRLEQIAQTQMDILSRVSHELRTPLHAVLGLADVVERLEAQRLSPRSSAHLGHIRQAAKHLLDIVSDMLDLTRVHGGRLPLDLQPVALQTLAGEVVALLEPLAAQRGQRLRVDGSDKQILFGRADRQRLRQVLINLLGNAIKYTPIGGTVSLRAQPGPAGEVQLEVRDNGFGIAPEHMERLFEPFYRIDNGGEGGSAAQQGSGLGLAIAQTLARGMGGDILADSVLGSGSCFRITLPAAPAPPAAPPVSLPPAGRPRRPPRPEPGSQLLYIEDNEVNRLLVESYLAERPEIGLSCYATGHAGLAAARRLRPTLILIDMQLPDMSGHELIRAILDDPLLYRTPCIAFSAEDSELAVAAAIRSGFREYLHKPITAGEFLHAIDRLLHETQPALIAAFNG